MNFLIFTRHLPIILFLALLNLACSKVHLHVVVADSDSIWIGRPIKAQTSVVNKGRFKVRVFSPRSYAQTQFFYKRDGDSLWSELPITWPGHDQWMLTIGPGKSTVADYWKLEAGALLEAGASYTLKTVYHPTRALGTEYDPNLKKQRNRAKHIIRDLSFATRPLPAADRQALEWLTSKEMLSLYLGSNDHVIDRVSYDKITGFLTLFPHSVFSDRMKYLYIAYAADRNPPPQNLSQADYETALRYWEEVKGGDFNSESFRLAALKEKLKHQPE